MPRKPRPLSRDGGIVRDADLIIVASEDKYAVEQYFSRFKTRRVQFYSLPTEDGRSSPSHVLDRLKEFAEKHVTETGDTFWLCIDCDRWPVDVLQAVARECVKREFHTAISNPCFELWILLHFEDASAEAASGESINKRLKAILGGYSKQCCRNAQLSSEMVHAAIRRARSMDNQGNELVPTTTATQVYKILELLLQKDRIQFV